MVSDLRSEVAWRDLEGGAHILIVDDDPEILDLVSRFLRKHGYRVTGVRNGIEMRESLAAAAIDLVILDLMLPGEGGLSLCREVRSRSSLPIIMLTAMGEEADRIVGLEMGALGVQRDRSVRARRGSFPPSDRETNRLSQHRISGSASFTLAVS